MTTQQIARAYSVDDIRTDDDDVGVEERRSLEARDIAILFAGVDTPSRPLTYFIKPDKLAIKRTRTPTIARFAQR